MEQNYVALQVDLSEAIAILMVMNNEQVRESVQVLQIPMAKLFVIYNGTSTRIGIGAVHDVIILGLLCLQCFCVFRKYNSELKKPLKQYYNKVLQRQFYCGLPFKVG